MQNIGQFAKQNGINPKTLRWYDQINLLKPEYVDKNTGYRFYGEKSLALLKNIHTLQSYGFTISEIKNLSPDVIEETQ